MSKRLLLLAAAALLCCAAYMLWDVKGSWSFALSYRGQKLLALILIGVSVSVSTVLFQTITGNRILTPSIMGFDALFMLILTGTVFVLGGQTYVRMSEQTLFMINSGALIMASLVLFGTLIRQGRSDLIRMVLTGLICGVFFRSLTNFMQRLIDPNEFAVIQGDAFASFTNIGTQILPLAGLLCGAGLIAAWTMRHKLDVVTLGADAAISLGVNLKRVQLATLLIISVLVSVSTALVGPVVFFGLLVSALTYRMLPSPHHSVLLPASALLGCITLIGGQAVLERVLHLSTPLAVVIDLLGGLVFLFLVLQRARS